MVAGEPSLTGPLLETTVITGRWGGVEANRGDVAVGGAVGGLVGEAIRVGADAVVGLVGERTVGIERQDALGRGVTSTALRGSASASVSLLSTPLGASTVRGRELGPLQFFVESW